jgi:hypothetical protein
MVATVLAEYVLQQPAVVSLVDDGTRHTAV